MKYSEIFTAQNCTFSCVIAAFKSYLVVFLMVFIVMVGVLVFDI
jgi:hypothetical protein